MKIYKKRVKNKKYLIAKDRIYLANGVTEEISKSFGSYNFTNDLEEKKNIFLKFIIKEEIEQRFEYWKEKIKDKKFLKYSDLKKIELFRTELYKLREKIGDFGNILDIIFKIDFIFNSNKIEGSKLPKNKVESIVKKGKIKKNDEVQNSIKAINKINNNFKFNVKQIIELHSILLSHEPAKLKLRKEEIVVGNSEVLLANQIRKELQILFSWYEFNKKKIYPAKLAFDFYYKFERIHPFVDGNGRVGRLLMNKILKDNRFHPIIIWDTNREAHFSAFKKAIDDRMEYYYKFMNDQMIKTYKLYIKKIKNYKYKII